MSEVATSPAPAAAAPAPAAAPESAPEVSAEPAVTDVAESPEPAGDLPESVAQASAEESANVPEVQPELLTDKTPFDPSTWDGNIDALPEYLKGPVQYLHRNLESGYTKKFQDLSEQRKTFESERDTWTTTRDEWETTRSELESERDLLKHLLEGHEDPRLGKLSESNAKLQADIVQLQKKYDDYQQIVQADIEEQSRVYAERFKAEHKEVFESDVKRQQLTNLLAANWTPETAVKLIGKEEKTIALATELRDKGAPPELAVEHALLKFGSVAQRAPRPAAQLTAGAESRNNPASAPGDTVHQAKSNHEARQLAAREAINWRKSQKLT